METISIKIDFPKDALLAADITEATASSDIKKCLALYMFKERVLSFGKASELSGMDKLSFIKLAGSKGISLDYDVEDYDEDISTLDGLAL